MEMVEPLGDTEGVYLEMALSGQQEITEKDMVKMAEMLEEYAHVDTQLRELEMLDSSEVTKGRSALLLAWEEEVHVESMKKLLGVSTFVPPDDSTALANVKIEPMCEGWAAKWTATVGDQELLLYIYAAGEGKRLRGLIDATLAVPMGDGGEEEGEIEHVSVMVEKEQLIKVLSRRLGVLPRGASRSVGHCVLGGPLCARGAVCVVLSSTVSLPSRKMTTLEGMQRCFAAHEKGMRGDDLEAGLQHELVLDLIRNPRVP